MVTIANIDIRGMISRLDRMLIEISKSQSASVPNGLLEADHERIKDYVEDYTAYWDYVRERPIPDTPEAHGVYTVEVSDEAENIAEIDNIQNEDIINLMHQMQVYRIEILKSQSGALTQGFRDTEGPGDTSRFAEGIQRISDFVEYVATTQPSDRPESTPRVT